MLTVQKEWSKWIQSIWWRAPFATCSPPGRWRAWCVLSRLPKVLLVVLLVSSTVVQGEIELRREVDCKCGQFTHRNGREGTYYHEGATELLIIKCWRHRTTVVSSLLRRHCHWPESTAEPNGGTPLILISTPQPSLYPTARVVVPCSIEIRCNKQNGPVRLRRK